MTADELNQIMFETERIIQFLRINGITDEYVVRRIVEKRGPVARLWKRRGKYIWPLTALLVSSFLDSDR